MLGFRQTSLTQTRSDTFFIFESKQISSEFWGIVSLIVGSLQSLGSVFIFLSPRTITHRVTRLSAWSQRKAWLISSPLVKEKNKIIGQKNSKLYFLYFFFTRAPLSLWQQSMLQWWDMCKWPSKCFKLPLSVPSMVDWAWLWRWAKGF